MRTLIFNIIILCRSYFIGLAACSEVESYEINKIELTPIHNAIIFNDIADIINEFENSVNSKYSTHIFSNSESEEDIEDLLSEYQKYLDKAHRQTAQYLEKTKSKNNVPLVRHEKFSKMQKSLGNSPDEDSSYLMGNIKYTPNAFFNPPHVFMPYYLNNKDNKPEDKHTEYEKNTLVPTQSTLIEKKLIDLAPTIKKSFYKPIFSCCKDNIIPYKCDYKECLISLNNTFASNLNRVVNDQGIYNNNLNRNLKHVLLEKPGGLIDDKLNIHIKIDVQLPNVPELFNFFNKNYLDQERDLSKETYSSYVPLQYLDFPVPFEFREYEKKYIRNPNAMHKITIHKKKKSRTNNGNKKHKSKKLITFHKIKIDSPWEKVNNTNKFYHLKNSNSSSETKYMPIQKNTLVFQDPPSTFLFNQNNTTNNIFSKKKNNSLDTILVTVNISKNEDTKTEETPKIENSIETDFIKTNENYTTVEPNRLKRDIPQTKFTSTITIENTTTPLPTTVPLPLDTIRNGSKTNKSLTSDSVLLYWPVDKNSSKISKIPSKNITAIILERETKKAKLNMTKDVIRNNRTVALEQAIFGEVDWNDVDTVAPVFMSFVGKYIRGILTFCSQSTCHSMNCANKICHHRVCTPDNRFNHKGHCTENNNAESVATMESIMDLPSNIAFEIVDILQNKMLGKMFGKVTLCIISKCNTFITFKKFFSKSKCTFKELSSAGHCPNVKTFKTT